MSIAPLVYTCRSIKDSIGISNKYYNELIFLIFGKWCDEDLTFQERKKLYTFLDAIYRPYHQEQVRQELLDISDEAAMEVLR